MASGETVKAAAADNNQKMTIDRDCSLAEREGLAFITRQEAALLTELTANNYAGEGVIVDGGSFLGASTIALARGVLGSAHSSQRKTIIAIDRFQVLDSYVHDAFLRAGRDIRFGESFLDIFLQCVEPYLALIEVRAGELGKIGRVEEPIEIAFIDIAKSRALNNFILMNWFPLLIPGRSIVIHQDFHGPSYNWIHVSMAALLDHFELVVSKADETAVFKLRRAITRADARRAAAIDPVSADGLFLLDRLLTAVPQNDNYQLLLSKCIILHRLGKGSQARELYEQLAVCAPAADDAKWSKWVANVGHLIGGKRADPGAANEE